MLKTIKNNIPNGITCLNALCGTLSVITSFYSSEHFGGLWGWQWSAFLILLAAVADFFDGFVARLLNASHPIGVELDSLSDQVSFGLAPAILLVMALIDKMPLWLALVPALLPVATALRLAKFNIDTRQTTGFLGMPVPANAVFWIGYVACLHEGATWLMSPWAVICAVLLMAWLMVSELPMLSLKFKSAGLRDNLARYLLILGSAVLLIVFRLQGMVWVIVFYVVMSLLFGRRQTE